MKAVSLWGRLGFGLALLLLLHPLRTARAEGTEAPISSESLQISGEPLSEARLRERWVGETLEVQMRSLAAELIDQGYLEARFEISRSSQDPQLLVEPGPVASQLRLASRVRGANSTEVDSLSALLARPETSRQYARNRLESLLANWVRDWAEVGFPFAVASVDSVRISEGVVEAGLSLEVGKRRVWGEVDFPGLTSTRPQFLRKLLRLRPGNGFAQSSLERAQLRLERSGLFSSVGDPLLESLEDHRLRVYFPVEENQHNRIEGAVGYSGESESVSGWVTLELGNLFGTGRSLDLRWERLREDRTLLDLAYREPLLWGLPIAARLEVQQEVRDSTYTLDRTEAALEMELGGDFVGEFGGEFRRSVLGTEPNSELVRRTSSLVGLRWDSERPTRFLGSRVGGKLLAGRSRIRPAEGERRSERVDRIELEILRWFAPSPAWRVRTRTQAAGLSGSRSRQLPLSEALWVGGSATLRGFPERAFATRRFAVIRIEAGPLLSAEPGRVYVFLDGGWFRDLLDGDDRRELGWGIGIANEGQGRSLIVDFGVPGGSSLSNGRLHLRLATRF